MNTVQCLWLLFAIFGCSTADNCEICLLTDEECMTKGAVNVYASVVAGNSGRPLDPMYIELIHGKKGSTEYNVTDIELIGLSACKVTKLDVDVNETVYKHHVSCPKLISKFKVEIWDASHPDCHHCHHCPQLHVAVTAHDYESANVGKYVILVGDRDFRPHVFLKNVHPTVTLKGDLAFDIIQQLEVALATNYVSSITAVDVFSGAGPGGNECADLSLSATSLNNTEDCHKWKEGIEFINALIVKRAMEIVMMDGIQAYCKDHNMSELFPKSKPCLSGKVWKLWMFWKPDSWSGC